MFFVSMPLNKVKYNHLENDELNKMSMCCCNRIIIVTDFASNIKIKKQQNMK